MLFKNKITIVLLLLGLSITAYAQQAIVVSGGNATGSNGEVNYTVGQVFYITQTGANNTVAAGVQQPFDISVITDIGTTFSSNINVTIFPNPTADLLHLQVMTTKDNTLKYELFDINGILLTTQKIESLQTDISMNSLATNTYILKMANSSCKCNFFVEHI